MTRLISFHHLNRKYLIILNFDLGEKFSYDCAFGYFHQITVVFVWLYWAQALSWCTDLDISDPGHIGPSHFGSIFQSFRPQFLRHFGPSGVILDPLTILLFLFKGRKALLALIIVIFEVTACFLERMLPELSYLSKRCLVNFNIFVEWWMAPCKQFAVSTLS